MLGSVHEHNLIHNWGCHIIDLARIKPKMHWKHHICPIFCSEFRNNHGQPHNKSLNKIIYNTVPPGLLVVWKLLNRSGDGWNLGLWSYHVRAIPGIIRTHFSSQMCYECDILIRVINQTYLDWSYWNYALKMADFTI